ncbi:hypothetical protein BH23VER1_BH23VER1_24050 [soil metagenome]
MTARHTTIAAIAAIAVLAIATGAWLVHRKVTSNTQDRSVAPAVRPAAESFAASSTADQLVATVRRAPSEFAAFAAASALAEIGDTPVLKALVVRFAEAPSVPIETFACDIALGRLAALDLPAAVELARDFEAAAKSHAAAAIAAALGIPDTAVAAKSRAAAAIAAALGIPDASVPLVSAVLLADTLSIPRAVALIQQLDGGDPNAVLAALREEAPASLHEIERDRLSALLATDPDGAIAEARAIDDPQMRGAMLVAVLTAYAAIDPAAAFEYCAKLDPSGDDYPIAHVRRQVIQRWIASDLPTAREKFFAKDFPLDRNTGNVISHALTRLDPELTLEWASEHVTSSRIREDAIEHVFRALGKDAPEKAIALLEDPSLIKLVSLGIYARQFVGSWAREQPVEAVDWALAQTGAVRENALDAIASNASRKNPAVVFELLESPALSPEERDKLLGRSTDLAASDMPRYLRLVGELPEEESFKELGKAASRLADDGNFADARAIVEAVGVGAATVDRSTQQIVTEMAKINPQSAREWIETFADPTARKWGVRNLVDAWARTDPNAAAAYVRELPAGSPEREQAAFVMAERTVAHDPEGALHWLASLADPDLRAKFFRDNIAGLLAHTPSRLADFAAENPDLQVGIDREKRWQAVLRGEPVPGP